MTGRDALDGTDEGSPVDVDRKGFAQLDYVIIGVRDKARRY
jgi:hypothetical protein